MALILDENSYVDLYEADEYFNTRIDSASWFDAGSEEDDSVQEQALVTATRVIDDQCWIGTAVSSCQTLAWPRKNACYHDCRLNLMVEYACDEIPVCVKHAVFEQALHLLMNEDLLSNTRQSYESISIGSISLSDSDSSRDIRIPRISPQARHCLRNLVERGSGLQNGQGGMWWRTN